MKFYQESYDRLHQRSQIVALQCVIKWICCPTKERYYTNEFFYFSPDVFSGSLKLEFYQLCIKTKTQRVKLKQLYLQFVCKCKTFSFFLLLQVKQVLFIFLHRFSKCLKPEKEGLCGILFFVDTSFICYK